MRTTIDAAGRVVIPKRIRAELGLTGGEQLEVELVDGNIEIAPAPVPMRLQGEGRDVYAVADAELPPLTPELVRDTLERVRR